MASVFTRVLKGELPGYILYEDEYCFALLALDQVQPGHTLVVPKVEVDHWIDVPETVYLHLQKVSLRVAKALKLVTRRRRVLNCTIGFEVPHYHFHLIPADHMVEFNFSKAKRLSSEEMSNLAEQIKSQLEFERK
jgi:histidine triad (HIT) family protein